MVFKLKDKRTIEVWNSKIKDAIRVDSHKNLSRYHSSYRNEETKIKYENILFTNVLKSVVNSAFKIPTLTVDSLSMKTSDSLIELTQNAYRSKLTLEWYLLNSDFKKEIGKCIVDSKIGYWGLMEIFKDKDSKLGYGIRRRSQFDLIIDPEGVCHDLSDSRWIALQWLKHKDILAGDSSLKNNKDLSGNYNPKINDPEYIKRKLTEPIGSIRKNKFEDLVLGWDVYDREKQEKLIIVDGRRIELFRGEWDIKVPVFPIIPLWYYFNPDRQLPISPSANIIIIEDEVNDLKFFQLNHARKISRTVNISRKGAFDNTTKRLIEESSRDILAETKKGSPSDAIHQLKEKTISFEYSAAIQSAKGGLSALGHGFIDSRNFETAAEPNIISANTQEISNAESNTVEDFVSRVLSMFFKLIQENSSSFIIPLNKNTYSNILKERSSILNKERMNQENAKIFATGSISLEDIIVKLPDGKFDLNKEGLLVNIPSLFIDKKSIKGDFKIIADKGSMRLESVGLAMGIYDRFKEDRLIHQGDLRRLVLKSFESSEIRNLLRPEQDVREEMNEQSQKNLQMSLAEPDLKKKADLEKTKLKTESNEKIAQEKNLVKVLQEIGKSKSKKN